MCKKHAGGDWARFNQLVESVPAGNNGDVMLYYNQPEIVPHTAVSGVFRFGSDGQPVTGLSPAEECRGVIEAQFLSMRLHLGE